MKKVFKDAELEVRKIVIDPDDETGIRFVSLVKDPATEMKNRFFSNQKEIVESDVKNYKFKAEKDKQMIVGPACIPYFKIYRRDEDTGEEYFVMFEPDTIQLLLEKFMKNSNNRAINYMHTNRMVEGYIQQIWKVEDSVYDKSKYYGYSCQPGTLFMEVKIEDKQFWENEVKDIGAYHFSIEGLMKDRPYYQLSKEYSDTIDTLGLILNMNQDELVDFILSSPKFI